MQSEAYLALYINVQGHNRLTRKSEDSKEGRVGGAGDCAIRKDEEDLHTIFNIEDHLPLLGIYYRGDQGGVIHHLPVLRDGKKREMSCLSINHRDTKANFQR